MRKHQALAALLWVVLTALGLVWALNVDPLPLAAAEEAAIIDDAFRLLLVLAIPVAATVLSILFYSFIRFRVSGDSEEDGPPTHNDQKIALGWFIVTTALAVFVVFNPGLKGLRELEAGSDAELVIQVEAEQWHWNVTYPQFDLSYERALQVAMPIDKRVKFEITTKDVIHSLWIPAFRMKMDAVPGRTTVMYVTPNEIASTEDDFNLRVQCAELCGTGHARMRMDVHIFEQDTFDNWIAEAQEMTSGGMEMDMGMDMDAGAEMDMDADSEMDMDADSEMDMDADSEMDMDADSEMNMSSDG